MAAPIIVFLQLMWRIRLLLVIVFLIMLGHIWLNDAERTWDSWHQPAQEQAFCDKEHKIPFVPPEQCGGMSSCDRLVQSGFLGRFVGCPK